MKRDEVSRLRTLQHSLERKIKTAQEKVDRLKTELSVVKQMIVLAKRRRSDSSTPGDL